MTTLRKVLVVDDDPVVAKSFDRVLSTKGYAVMTASNGEEALRKMAAEDYDVVYTDIRMPGMDGIEVAERIKGRQPWLPVVIVTGYGTEENEARAKAAGVNAVLHKPLSPEMIENSARVAFAEGAVAHAARAPAPIALQPAVEEENAGAGGVLKTIGIGLAAPFVGLAYVVGFPLIGLGALAYYAGRALYQRRLRIALFVKNVTLFLAAPLIGLLYVLAAPFVGLGMLAWMAMGRKGAKAVVERVDAD